MDLTDLGKMIEEDSDALEYALRHLGPAIEGRMWEFKAKDVLERLGFRNLELHSRAAHYDYVGEKNGPCFIEVKLRTRDLTSDLIPSCSKNGARFILDHKDCFFTLTKEGLFDVSERAVRRLEQRFKVKSQKQSADDRDWARWTKKHFPHIS